MTEPVPVDENLKKVRERVMQLAREIEQMSGQEIPPPIYFQEFLTRVVTAVGARAGVVWLLDESGRLSLLAQMNLEQTGLRETPGALGVNEKLLVEVMQTGEARTLTHGGESKLPTEHVLVLSALHKEKKCVGVVELFQRPDVPVKAQSG
ncbi:MAG: GAF domain-containing protein, partial [Planctomycetota bacterium]